MKRQNDYYEMMENQVGYCQKASKLLMEILSGFNPQHLELKRAEMHAIEHEADNVRHDAMQKLAREFITPIERDDILKLVQIIDDVTDAIDEVVIDLYMYNIRSLPSHALSMAELVNRCVCALQDAVKELRFFKKSEKLPALLIEVNNIESEADAAYVEALHALFSTEKDALRVLGVKEIYDSLESCCDSCEHAADVIENTVMNNS